jgi:uncharacterized protein YndB with AHSA1/START domain
MANPGFKPPPLVISRTFPAPRAALFQAFSSAEHMKNWFSPAGYSVPEAEIDFRPGGTCAICMQAPDGSKHWSRGHYLEISPPDHLSFTAAVSFGDKIAFTAHTQITLAPAHGGTELTVTQHYEIFDPAFHSATEGAAEGWRTTLDKLEREAARILGFSAVHDSFTLQRTYAATPAQVFHALTDAEAKAKWFAAGDGYTTLAREIDVRPGGREHVSGRWESGLVSTFDALYFDVVPNARLVYTYEMHLNDRKISVSLATAQLQETANGTLFTLTEQGTFLDGYEDAGSRKHGTGFLLDRMGESLSK